MHAGPRPPAFIVLCIRTPKVIGRTLTIVCPWVLQRRGCKASQSMMLSVSTLGILNKRCKQCCLTPEKTHCHLRGVGVALLIVVPAHRQAIFIYFSLSDYAAFLGISRYRVSRHPRKSLSFVQERAMCSGHSDWDLCTTSRVYCKAPSA